MPSRPSVIPAAPVAASTALAALLTASTALATPAASAAAPTTAAPSVGATTTSASAPGTSAVSPTASGPTTASTAGRAVGVVPLFSGAAYAAGARRAPSTGGVRLATRRAATLPLHGVTIVVDGGHNGVYAPGINKALVPAGNGQRKSCNTSGTATRAGYAEHAHNWDVAVRLAALLQRHGATVVLTRPSDRGVGPCVNERAAIGNRVRATLVVSIHADGVLSATARGLHVITSTTMVGGSAVEARSLRLAAVLRDAMTSGTGMPRSTYTGGAAAITRRTDIAGLNLSKVPAVMLEVGNMAQSRDAALLSSAAFRAKEATALAAGIAAYLKR